MWRWAKSNKKKDGVNHYYFPPAVGNIASKNYLGINCATWYRDKGVLSLEVTLATPFEWHNTRAMSTETGRTLAETLGVTNYLYYTQQPSRGKKSFKGHILYFQQFCAKTETPPTDATLHKLWDILQEAPIEGEECGEYKYLVSKAGTAPIDRTREKLLRRKAKQDSQ